MSAQTQLDITGMTCASCVARVEKKLNGIDGVQATVNLATSTATVVTDNPVPDTTLVAAVESAGYHARVRTPMHEHGGHQHEDLPVDVIGRRLLAAIPLSLAVLVLVMTPLADNGFAGWLQLALATPVAWWAAWPFHRAAAVNARHLASTMDTLVSVGVIAAWTWSTVAVLADTGQPLYYEVAAVVTTFLLLGRWLEARAKASSGAALHALLRLGAKSALVRRGADTVEVPISELVVGDEFVVRPGEKIATDGRVIDGASTVDVSMITGEPIPEDITTGHDVIGGTVNGSGRLVVRATRVGQDTQLAQLARLVEAAQTGKAPVQRLADRVSAIFVPVVFAIAALTLAGWLLTGHSAADAFTAAVAVLVIACPCALGLATPTALLVGTGRAAQLGIVVRGPQVLESTRRADTIVLDKTGTVTTAQMRVHDVTSIADAAGEDVLRLAGAVEAASEHPIAAAITAAAGDRGALPEVRDFQASGGLGVRGTVDSRRVSVGRASWHGGVPAAVQRPIDDAHQRGLTAVVVSIDDEPCGVITVGDTVKDSSAEAVHRLRVLGLRPVLLTGDNAAAARAVAAEVGIDEVIADVLPADKVAAVERLQRAGNSVAMVGDGVNDAAALAQADLGIAMGTGTDVAIEAADLTIMRGDLRLAADAIRLARRTLSVIKANLFWAFAYNAAGIPIAALGLLNPMIAGAAMAFSSVLVVTNSLRLRRFR
jgi:P-type Cu+ transporter